MRGVGFRPRISVQLQPVLCWCDGVAETTRSALSRCRINNAVPAGTKQDTYCLQGRAWGYPGNCLFSSYAQCMAAASGTGAACGINPQYLFAPQRNGTYRGRY